MASAVTNFFQQANNIRVYQEGTFEIGTLDLYSNNLNFQPDVI